jgi:hypothetical protein
MNSQWIHKSLLILVLAGATLSVGCGGGISDGTYKDPQGAVTLELKGGKATLNYGGIRIDGAYTVDGDKLSLRPTAGDTSQAMVLTVNKDGSIDGPPGTEIKNLRKAN